jgi:hypothetical protein
VKKQADAEITLLIRESDSDAGLREYKDISWSDNTASDKADGITDGQHVVD